MSLKHRELELKFDPNKVNLESFLEWGFTKKPIKYLSVEGPDYFYSQNDNFVRIRVPQDTEMELTTKRRINSNSLKDRVEVDLLFNERTKLSDLELFLETSGFKYEFKLNKRADIFWLKQGTGQVTISFYTATLETSGNSQVHRSFIEIEASKDSNVTVETAKGYLKKWLDEMQYDFNTEFKVVNNSLYEIFKDIKERKNDAK